jgi:GNAT superfamily N-acetyltransferase
MTRRIESKDIASALRLSTEAGWNQTAADWQTLVDLEPDGCFALDGDNGIAATATLICYGERLGWLGMVLTRADYRRRGFARRLVTAALEYADQRGVPTIKLDATNQGQPLYESLGFRAEMTIERWRRPPTSQIPISAPGLACCETLERLDREAFRVDRARLLTYFRNHGHRLHTREHGCVLTRPGSRATYIGPLIARSPEVASELLHECLVNENAAKFWDILPENEKALALAHSAGFRKERALVRMSRGAELRHCTHLTYGVAGFEFG